MHMKVGLGQLGWNRGIIFRPLTLFLGWGIFLFKIMQEEIK